MSASLNIIINVLFRVLGVMFVCLSMAFIYEGEIGDRDVLFHFL